MQPMVITLRYEYVGTVKVDGLCHICALPSLVESIGVIEVGTGLICNRIRHCTDCGWWLQ